MTAVVVLLRYCKKSKVAATVARRDNAQTVHKNSVFYSYVHVDLYIPPAVFFLDFYYRVRYTFYCNEIPRQPFKSYNVFAFKFIN